MSSVHDAASYFIWRAGQDGNLLTHLKLQKLCYYAQGYALALTAEPMFSDPIEAWEHGPVIRALWDQYRQYRKSPIPSVPEQPEIEPWRLKILDLIHQRFGWMSAWELRNRTHAEVPWRDAWLSEEPNAQLSHDSMKQFFRSTLRGERRIPKPADRAAVIERLNRDESLREATDRGRAEVTSGQRRRWN